MNNKTDTQQSAVRAAPQGTFGATLTAHDADRLTGEMCKACADCVYAAAATARATGAADATHTAGEHSAKVRRINAIVQPL